MLPTSPQGSWLLIDHLSWGDLGAESLGARSLARVVQHILEDGTSLYWLKRLRKPLEQPWFGRINLGVSISRGVGSSELNRLTLLLQFSKFPNTQLLSYDTIPSPWGLLGYPAAYTSRTCNGKFQVLPWWSIFSILELLRNLHSCHSETKDRIPTIFKSVLKQVFRFVGRFFGLLKSPTILQQSPILGELNSSPLLFQQTWVNVAWFV